jgi:hypothetical protein
MHIKPVCTSITDADIIPYIIIIPHSPNIKLEFFAPIPYLKIRFHFAIMHNVEYVLYKNFSEN